MEGCTVSKPKLYLARILVLIAVLAGWQYLPDISALRSRYHFLNPFFISSPEGVVKRMAGLASAPDWSSTVWPYLWQTVEGTLIGFAIGAAGGFIVGLTFSNAPRLNQVFGVFLMALNTLPRIALIPIIILLVGPGTASGVISAISVVFFLVFFNAFDGGTRVPGAVVSNARVMNASPLAIMAHVRLPYVILWTFAVVPNALAFGLLAVVATEILSGTDGVGSLLLQATSTLDAATTMAVVVYLSIVGVIMLQVAEFAKRRLLHWADTSVV
jgi:NitT/TauT family transport system permease protein